MLTWQKALAAALLFLTIGHGASAGQQILSVDRYGDPLPEHALARLGTVRFRPGNDVYSLAYSPDGHWLATAGGLIIHIWEASTGKLAREIPAGRGAERGVRFSPNGKLLAACNYDKTIGIWDAATGRAVAVLTGHWKPAHAIEFAPDGKTLTSSGWDGTVRIWDVESAHEIRLLMMGGWVRSLAYSPDGATLAAGNDQGLVLFWDAKTGRRLHRLETADIHIASLAYAPDGRTLAIGIGRDRPSHGGEVRIWDTVTKKEVRRWAHPCGVGAVAFSRDGHMLAVAEWSQGAEVLLARTSLWNVNTGERVRTLAAQGGWGNLAFSPDGKTLATAGLNNVELWDPVDGKELTPARGHRGSVLDIAFIGGNRRLVSASVDGTVRLWDLESGNVVHDWNGNASWWHPMACAPDGRSIAAAGSNGSVRIWNSDTGQVILNLPPSKKQQYVVAYSADGTVIITGDEEGNIRRWDTSTGRQINHLFANGQVTWIGCPPDARLLAAGYMAESALRLWNVQTGATLGRINLAPRWISSGSYSPDGKTLAWCNTHMVYFSNADTLKVRYTLQIPKTMFRAIAYSPDGRMLLTGESYVQDRPAKVRLWELATRQQVAEFSGHRVVVDAVVFSTDGRLAASGGSDTSILIWDIVGRDRILPANLNSAQLGQLWSDLAGTDAARAYRAICAMASASDDAVRFLRECLKPAAGINSALVKSIIVDLDNERFAVRQQAIRKLVTLGQDAEPALRKSLADPITAEARRSIERVLEEMQTDTPESLQKLRALQALEMMPTPNARDLLLSLSTGAPDARLTVDAKATLARIARRPAVDSKGR